MKHAPTHPNRAREAPATSWTEGSAEAQRRPVPTIGTEGSAEAQLQPVPTIDRSN